MIILASENPVARVQHGCQLCGRTIEPGEQYNRQRNIGDDGPYVFKACAHCHAYTLTIDLDYDDDRGYGLDDLVWHQPRTITEARWYVQHRRRWQRRDGALYPIPGCAA